MVVYEELTNIKINDNMFLGYFAGLLGVNGADFCFGAKGRVRVDPRATFARGHTWWLWRSRES